MPAELQEAINAATAAGTSQLIQKYIDPLILEYVRRYSPLLAAVPTKQISTNAYYFVQRTALPDGGAVVDGGARPVATSTWNQPVFNVKNYQAVGAVTGFAQAVTAGVIGDLLRAEVDGAMKNLTWAVETSALYGHDAATAGIGSTYGPDMLGLDYQVSSFSGSSQNAIDEGENTLSLSMLDNAIDMVEENAAEPIANRWMFIMSPQANSKVAQLLVNQQRFVGSVEVAAGLNVPTYRDVPIVKSSFLSARTQTFGTVTTSTSTSGGSLAAATYYYRVSAVINRFGEVQASTEVSQATTGTTSTVTLSFSTPSGPDGNSPVLYKVYRSTAAGAETLVGVCAAVDDQGNLATSIVDTGAGLQVNGRAGTLNSGAWPTGYVGANSGAKPRGAGDQDAFLIPMDADYLVRPYVRDFFSKDLAQTSTAPDTLPFYVQSDTCLAVRAPKYVGRIARFTASL